MPKTLLLVLVFFSLLETNGQIIFKSTNSYKLPNISNLDSIFKIDKEYDFQLRIRTGSGVLSNSSIFLFTIKGDDTTIRFFRLKSIDSTQILHWIEVPVLNANVKKYWAYVKSRHICELPSMKQIFKKHNLEKFRTMDGLSYWIELLSGNGQRGSWYHCPQSNFRNYPTAIEFKWVTDILEATFKLVEEKPLLCKTVANMAIWRSDE